MSDKPRRWRPWQFSLRTLLTLLLAVGCFFGGWTARDWQLRRELEQATAEAERQRKLAEARMRARAVVPGQLVLPGQPIMILPDREAVSRRDRLGKALINDLPATGLAPADGN